MGRTLLSSTMLIESEKNIWNEFRRALRKEDRAVFDKIFSFSKIHSPSISNCGAMYPFEPILLSIILEQQKQIDRLVKGDTESASLFD